MSTVHKIGRRKTSVARVYVKPGSGVITINKKDSLKVLEKSVKGMLPKNKLGSILFTNLYLYEGTEHKHEAQQPKVININEFK